MKTQLPAQLERDYITDLWRIRMGLLRKYGSQKKVSEVLHVDESHLCKILTGVVDCNCKLFWLLIKEADLSIFPEPFEDL